MPVAGRPLKLVLLWHMHQPEYRDYGSGEFRLPWVYLHALKDYADMAWHLEHHPGVQAVVNFTPVLLDQLEDYAEQLASGKLRDPLLRLLARPAGEPIAEPQRSLIVERCFPANHAQMQQPFSAYQSLHELLGVLKACDSLSLSHLSDQYFDDLLVWHHLRWTGESVRRESRTVMRLLALGTRFSAEDRRALFEVVAEVVRAIIPRYAKLAASGRIELSATPQHHPLAPLLINFAAARESEPSAPLPQSPGYPGGYGSVRWQLESALESHRRRFGAAPAGIWPAEGGISAPFLELLAAAGCRWAASGGQVLKNSLGGEPGALLYRPQRFTCPKGAVTLFFRDDRLSDRIGFEYAKWNSHDAAANLIAELEAIAAAAGADAPLVSIILDGENCWERYAYNGYYFLSALYQSLESHPAIRTATYSGVAGEATGVALPRLVAGSWVYGSFSTWIGTPEKNRAWELLCSAKQSFDLAMAGGRLTAAQAEAARRQLAACEASDWFWWIGSGNHGGTVAEFEALFRSSLGSLYRLLDLPAPATLDQPIGRARAGGDAQGAMRRSVKESVPVATPAA